MPTKKTGCALLLCLLPVVVYHFTDWPPVEDEITRTKELLLDDVFRASLRAVEFLSTNYFDINVDGLYGFRVCQGSLIGTLHDCSFENLRCPNKLKYELMSIIARLHKLCDMALPFIEPRDNEYYRQFLPVLEAPFMFNYIPEKWHWFPHQVPQSEKTYNSLMGNKCFSGILGTFSNRGRKFPPCTVVDGCWEMMSTTGTSGYFTTHQLLYLLFGEYSGCQQDLEDRSRKDTGMSLRDLQRFLCQQIYTEAMLIEDNGTKEETAQDLFLEQSALCGILGFEDFFNETWIRMVLGWQHVSGCFTQTFHKLDREENDEFQTGLDSEETDKFETGSDITSRKLMTEMVMSGDCLSHKTGVGAAALGAYIRYLVSRLHSNLTLAGSL
ncbi:unnamed protein product [Candidula unifasciata]|uniref:Uncharacterized protein n=1 Tax=Candidula unifasciata TaxID=100452 RepID=A0A8S3Z5H9_9EUPU|nr:unnamed protein product [Candidula unifasciata]